MQDKCVYFPSLSCKSFIFSIILSAYFSGVSGVVVVEAFGWTEIQSVFFRVVLLLQASTMQQTTARPLLSLPFSRCYEIGTFGALLVVCCVLVLLSCC